ncbi:branched chain amino acid ABC transporter inner membrane protein [Caballeronia sordidicola]|uniref:Branched chain amino acid ABC transporter inner membrane protein n=1 Tax=Caballeronia sordidicola TaxID=196367 RepID=A0A158GEP7_CABSO|nr:branched-chain amino acid ABC transporter permease [Caballeronia sordidicola]SAL30099.1 branched chain amino acid ABC transporter inner membrane protein [Caballeronia sordidicola]
MNVILQIIVSGCAVGMIYAVTAFGYQLTFATSGTMNFAQGQALAVGALMGLTILQHVGNYWLMIPIVLVMGAIVGVITERISVRSAVAAKSEGWIMATIALGIIMTNMAENIWGTDDLKFPSPLPDTRITVWGASILPMELLVIAGALALMAAVEVFNRKTIYGRAVIATASDADAAGLMGINTRLVVTFSYALSCMSAAFAGILIAPLTVAGADMGATLGLKAFAVAIIGGLTSGMGIIAGGVILGVAETFTGYYVSSGYKDVPGLLLLLAALAIKPAGLFGRTSIKKV